MKDTSNFRTKTNFFKRNNGKISDVWEIALDIGYSAVKLISPNMTARFPSYAKRVDNNFSFVGEISEKAIMYKDLEYNEMWIVGEVAQNIMSANETADSEASLYNREWFRSPMFQVLANVGYGVAMQSIQLKDKSDNPYILKPEKDEKIVVQTGLPEKYMSNESEMKEVLSGKRHFAIKIGSGEWQEFNINIAIDNIFVISQPKGSLFSVCIDKNGKFHEDAKKYLSSSVIVFDAGFGTLDIFPIKSGVVGNGETDSNLGMKRILQITSAEIKEQFNIDVPVPAMQKNLETGKVRYKSMKKGQFISKEYEFGNILVKASSDVCNEAIEKLANTLDLIDFNYLIVTGGTGAAWFNQIKETFKEFETLDRKSVV